MAIDYFPISESALPYNDLDGKSVEFDLSSSDGSEPHVFGTGSFDLIPCPEGKVRLAIHCDMPGELVRIPMRQDFLPSLKRNPPGSKAEFSLTFRQHHKQAENC